VLFCLILLLSQLLGAIGLWPATALASSRPHAAPASMTFQKFLQEGRSDHAYHGPLIRPQHPIQAPTDPHHQPLDHRHLPPSAQPPTMAPLHQTLDAIFLTGGAGAKPLDLHGSDQRLEVRIAPGSFDLAHATTSTGKPVTGTITLAVTQQYGLFPGQVPVVGSYTLQLVDSQGHPLSGVTLRQPITYLFHYQPADLAFFYLDPGQIFLTFPVLLQAARSQHHPVGDFVVRLSNDAQTHTLTGQSHGLGPFDLGSDTNIQSPPTPHLASVGGNTGQLSYTYPLALAPGPSGMPTSLALSYSSESTNERHSIASPTGDVGEGWSLSFGSITADVYTSIDAGGAATWYSINNVAGVSDRLVPYDKDNTSFLTQHISPLKIQQVQSKFGQPCFNVWDANGTEYLFGCTPDSLQYYTKSDNTRVNYRWDLNSIILANEGPHTGAVSMALQYLQDSTQTNGQTSIHDSVVWQATVSTSTGVVADTIDFFYRGRADQSIGNVKRATAYGNNYNCTPILHHPVPNPATILRCDDPVDASGGLPAPVVLSTYSLQTIKSYLGTDASSNNLAYSYSFSYIDHPYWSCTDDWTQNTMNCAGDHLLRTVTPTVYLKGVGTARHSLSLVYNTATSADDYFDTSKTLPSDPSQYFHESTYWNYLTSYEDTATGEGASSITYALAYNNTHGTPATSNPPDNRLDPLYCDTHSDCTGNFAYPDDRAWAVQVVTQITATGSDSSATASAQTRYAYSLRVTESASCTPYPPPPAPNPDKRCVGDEWMPAGSTDVLSYYQSEYHGFSDVYITSPAGDLTDQTYYSNDDWGSLADSFNNYLSGALWKEAVYQGNSTSGPLLLDILNTYAGTISGENDSCNGNYSGLYTPCAVLMLISLTTFDEGGANAHPPTIEEDNTFDDYANVQGASLGAGYNNLITQVIKSSNAPTLTKKWTYTPNDRNVGGWIYHDVNKVTKSEVDDSNGTVWSCQTTAYDEGVANVPQQPPTPAQGLPTTVTTASDCSHQSQSAITSNAGYDSNGNTVASVDGLGTANASFYGSSGLPNENGCTLSSNPAVFPTSWGKTNYTTCATYDSLTSQPTVVAMPLVRAVRPPMTRARRAYPAAVRTPMVRSLPSRIAMMAMATAPSRSANPVRRWVIPPNRAATPTPVPPLFPPASICPATRLLRVPPSTVPPSAAPSMTRWGEPSRRVAPAPASMTPSASPSTTMPIIPSFKAFPSRSRTAVAGSILTEPPTTRATLPAVPSASTTP